MAAHNHGVPRLPGDPKPAAIVKQARNAVEVRSEHKRNAAYKERLQTAKSISEVLAIAREISQFAHGKNHSLWFEYYEAVRKLDNWSGGGYTSRAITPRADTAAASRHFIPIYDEHSA